MSLAKCLRILSSAIRSSPRATTFTSLTNLVAATRNAHDMTHDDLRYTDVPIAQVGHVVRVFFTGEWFHT